MDKDKVLKRLNEMNANTLMEALEIQFSDVGEDFIEATMPVGPKVHQPYGIMHGGASIALAETVGSVLSAISLNTTQFNSVGMQMNAHSITHKKDDMVTAETKLIGKRRTTKLIKK